MANIFSKLRGLIPTARVDKNGRVVIRHMKPEDMGVSEPQATLPPPQPRPVASQKTVREAMDNVLEAAGIDSYDWHHAVTTMNVHMEKLLPSTLERMASLKNSDEGQVAHSIYKEFYEAELNETLINDLVQLSSHIGERDLEEAWIASSVLGFQSYDNLCPMGADGSYPEERYSQCAALFDVTQAMRDLVLEKAVDKSEFAYGSGDTRMLSNKKLVDYILSAKDPDREKIAGIIRSRKMTDPDSIKALIEAGETTALSSGAL